MLNVQPPNSVTDIVCDYYGASGIGTRKKHCKRTRVTRGTANFVMQCDIELPAICEFCQAVLQCKSFKRPIELFKGGMGTCQLRLST